MSYSLLVVCEAPGDFALAERLIDRTIQEHGPEWCRGDLDSGREYFGIHTQMADPTERYVRWKNLEAVTVHAAGGDNGKVRRLQLSIDQFGDSFPPNEEARTFLRFVRVVQTSDQVRQPDAFVLLRDTDSKDRTGLRSLNAHPQFKRFPAVVGVPDPETECWLLVGFLHEATEPETRLVEQLQRQLGVHPCRDTHRLRAANEGDDRHPKRVLALLTSEDAGRVAQCLEAPFDLLRTHGGENGLAEFLDQLQCRLIPGLYGGSASNPAA